MARGILGDETEARFANRRAERLQVPAAMAGKRRLRASTGSGLDVALDLPRGTYLRHGAVLCDEDDFIVVVERPPEDALLVSFDGAADAGRLDDVARIGTPSATSTCRSSWSAASCACRSPPPRRSLKATVERTGATGVTVRAARVRLGSERPMTAAHGHDGHGSEGDR